ncbi:hypothetical protein C1645_811825 [Glomus cerebriforme]|uniref:Uncharacterized protein n=1 Tax=Glomus cerebriforme TaxID=658196 RepID=A0A397TLF9_9GLOM|nr:hypothetical protein C1645_811825 [Glomus cerebriforme]
MSGKRSISKAISHSESQHELKAKYTTEIKSLKSNIKTLKREATLAQKASSADKIKILSLKAKVRELEGKLDDLKLEQVLHNSNVVEGLLEEPVQINSSDSKEIDSLRLELNRANEDLSSKEHIIECIEKGIESLNIDSPLLPMNELSQLDPEGTLFILNLSSKIISIGDAEAVSLPATVPIIKKAMEYMEKK